MADEINLQFGLSAARDGIQIGNTTDKKVQNMQTTLGGAMQTRSQFVTAKADVDLGDIVNHGTGNVDNDYFLLLINAGQTDVNVYVQKDAGTDVLDSIMKPGEPYGPMRKTKQTAGYPKTRVESAAAGNPVVKIEIDATEAGDPAT